VDAGAAELLFTLSVVLAVRFIQQTATILVEPDVHESVHRDAIMKVTNEMQLYRLIFYS